MNHLSNYRFHLNPSSGSNLFHVHRRKQRWKHRNILMHTLQGRQYANNETTLTQTRYMAVYGSKAKA
jgi:hypothetical protein